MLSDHFFYFGREAIKLPDDLRVIAQNQRGHRVHLNDSKVDAFVEWIETQRVGLHGTPLMELFGDEEWAAWCAGCRREQDEDDEPDPSEDAQTPC